MRHRVIANPGRIEGLTPRKLDPLIGGLNRALGRAGNTASGVISDSARAHGDVFALHEIWKQLGFDRALQGSVANFSKGEFRLSSGPSYAASPAKTWNGAAPFPRICPLQITCAVSIPAILAAAE